MPVPDYQAAMLPLLRLVSERQTVKLSECIDMLADHFGLTTTERSEMLDSGVQSRWGNRVSWAASYLVHAGVLRRPAKGILEVTDAGKQLLVDAPDALTNSYLMRYPSFVEFKQKSKSAPSSGAVIQPGVETAGSLSQTKLVSPSFFERLVVQLLVKMGYGGSFKDAAQAIGKTGDGGIDGIIKEDRLGLDFVAVQAKRWENSVGREVIQTFAGSLMGHGASKGVLITTSAFTSGAKEYAQKISTNKIVLIDGEQLAELMLDYGIGVTDVTNYRIQRVDSDYFEAE
jgi:restriction system protein